jgi:hypothetical protein
MFSKMTNNFLEDFLAENDLDLPGLQDRTTTAAEK